MINDQEHFEQFMEAIQAIPTLSSVPMRLALQASNTELGELNTLLNDAYVYIGQLEKELRTLKAGK